MRKYFAGRGLRAGFWIASAAFAGSAQAFDLGFPFLDDRVDGTLETTATFGAAIRMEAQDKDILGKADNNPHVCDFPNQGCQGVFRTQGYPAAALTRQQGLFSMNNDDGDLNYDKGDLIGAPFTVREKLQLHYGEWGLTLKGLYFYDAVNNNFREHHPNRITNENKDRVGTLVQGPESTGYLDVVHQGQRVYGPGGVVNNRRSDGETLRQIGTDFQMLDAFISGQFQVAGHDVGVKVGRQILGWGESTTLVINSLNQANPVNANNLYRVGYQLEDIFIPVNMASFTVQPVENTTLEAYYQFEWRGIDAPAEGSFYSTNDVGTNNAIDWVNLSFGQAADDPDGVGIPLNNPLSGITHTNARSQRVRDLEPDSQGQFGIALKYYADWLNNGTDLGLYYENYHSRLPYVSFYATHASCARAEGNLLGINANNPATFLLACPDLPTAHPFDPAAATSDAVPLDTGRIQLEYPENIHLIGLSFNTTFGDYALQGELAYRPNMPLQVAIMDVAFDAAGPLLTRCHEQSLHCVGSHGGLGTDENGNATIYPAGEFVPRAGQTPYNDTFDLAVGNIDGSARSFPSFLAAYRHEAPGEHKPTDPTQPYNHGNPGYVQGFERFQMLSFNLGATRIFSATENPIKADQIILLFEGGVDWIPDLPKLDRLQIQGPATFTHASAGADGSGANGSRQACAGTVDCSIGVDGARFNPHQQDKDGYVTPVSAGYRLISFIKYESVLPNIGVQPFILFSHDLWGISPGPAQDFIKDRLSTQLAIETRYRADLSLTLGYNWFWGGGTNNLMSDRDNALAYVKYQF